jgi:hypothetical protein
MPFIDDDDGEGSERLSRALLCQHEREAFGRRHEKTRRLSRQRRARASRCVAGAGADPPERRAVSRRDVRERLAQRPLRVRSERTHRRDPEHAEPFIRVRYLGRREPGAKCDRQRLA